MNDILEAVNDFILKYGYLAPSKPLEQGQIVRGWQNYGGLPQKTAEVCIMSLLGAVGHGRPAYKAQGGIEERGLVYEQTVQVDMLANPDLVDAQVTLGRVQRLAVECETPNGVAFFKPYGVAPLYASDVRALPFTGQENTWLARYSIDLHLSVKIVTQGEYSGFSTVEMPIENIDMHHNPTEG